MTKNLKYPHDQAVNALINACGGKVYKAAEILDIPHHQLRNWRVRGFPNYMLLGGIVDKARKAGVKVNGKLIDHNIFFNLSKPKE